MDASSRDESSDALRSVCGALALTADVEVVTRWGPEGTAFDGAFKVHRLNSDLEVRPRARIKAEILTWLAAHRQLVSEDSSAQWAQARAVVTEGYGDWSKYSDEIVGTAPDLILVAGERHVGVVQATLSCGVPVLGAPLLTNPSLGLTGLFDRIPPNCTQLAFSPPEHRDLTTLGYDPQRIVDVGLHFPVNPSVHQEPATFVSGRRYVLVLCPGSIDDESREGALARIAALAHTEREVVVIHADRCQIWRDGRSHGVQLVERDLDLWRLMAWSEVVVDLRPGSLVGRRVIEAMRLAKPVIAPRGSRAADLLQESRGGLAFSDAAELLSALSALDGPIAANLGTNGKSFADDRYGQSEKFVDRVSEAFEPYLARAGAGTPQISNAATP